MCALKNKMEGDNFSTFWNREVSLSFNVPSTEIRGTYLFSGVKGTLLRKKKQL